MIILGMIEKTVITVTTKITMEIAEIAAMMTIVITDVVMIEMILIAPTAATITDTAHPTNGIAPHQWIEDTCLPREHDLWNHNKNYDTNYRI